jgi:hypothetical protein
LTRVRNDLGSDAAIAAAVKVEGRLRWFVKQRATLGRVGMWDVLRPAAARAASDERPSLSASDL